MQYRLAPHIAFAHSALGYEAVRVEHGEQTDPGYLAVNPLGRVPALVTTGHGKTTEVPTVLSYIAEATPAPRISVAFGVGLTCMSWMAHLTQP